MPSFCERARPLVANMVLDGAVTTFGLIVGLAHEGNPLIKNLDPAWILPLKGLVVALVVVALVAAEETMGRDFRPLLHGFISLNALAYGGLVIWNVVQVGATLGHPS